MRKLIFIVALLIIPLIYGLEECKSPTNKDFLPCKISTTWQPPLPCGNYSSSVFNSTYGFIYNYTLQSEGAFELCYMGFNQSTVGTYYVNFTTGDTAVVQVEKQDNMLPIILLQIFIVSFFILIGLPHKAGFIKVISWGLGVIELLMTVWMVYINEVGGSIDNLLYINALSVLIVGGTLGFITLFMVNVKLMKPHENDIKDDAYTKWLSK